MKKSMISIIICTHHHFNLLHLAVQSFCHQTASREIFEVIIVDNDISSNKEVIKIVDDAKANINIRYLHEPVLGLSQARNTGGKAALAEYVGYMDDDAKAKNNYIEVLLKVISYEKVDVIGGPYFAFYLTPKPLWFKDKYVSIDSGVSHFMRNGEFLNGTNMVYRKSLLEKANWFDTSFGMTGNQIAYGEETDLQIRLWQNIKDLKVYYSRDLVVYHFVPPQKMKLRDKFKRSYSLGKSQAYMWISNESIRRLQLKAPLNIFKALTRLVLKEIPRLFIRDKRKYPFWQNYAYEVLSKYFASLGQEIRYLRGK